MPLPTFDPKVPVSPAHGKEDRIQLALGAWYVGIKTKHPTEGYRATRELRGALMEGKIFSRVEAKRLEKPIPIRISKGGHGDDESQPYGPGDNVPLFGGELETNLLKFMGNDLPEEIRALGFNGAIQLKFRSFNMNPMRYVRHQNLPMGESWGKARWFKNSAPLTTGGEFALTNDDNWIPVAKAWDAFASPENWQRHLRRYIARVTRVIIKEITKAICLVEEEDWPFEFSLPIECPDYAIRELETCWEFEDSDPCERIRTLRQRLVDLGHGDLSVSVYQGQVNLLRHKGRENKQFNSPSIYLKLRSGVDLRVYAKTNRRVRFEIIQQSPNRKELLSAANITFLSSPKPYSEIPHLLKQARQRAANMLNEIVFPAIASEPDLRIRQRSVMSFLADFAKASIDARSLRAVISLLISNGSIEMGVSGKPAPDDLVEIINRLKCNKPKLLVWNAAANSYQVTPPYRWALEHLRQMDSSIVEGMLGRAPPRQR